MSFTVIPKYGEAREINVWVWRPMVELIYDAKLVDDKKYKSLGFNDGTQIDAVTAWKIGDLLAQTVEKMGPKDYLQLDLSINQNPGRWGQVIETEQGMIDGYSVSRDWLREFGEFSRDSGGFEVY